MMLFGPRKSDVLVDVGTASGYQNEHQQKTQVNKCEGR